MERLNYELNVETTPETHAMLGAAAAHSSARRWALLVFVMVAIDAVLRAAELVLDFIR